MPSMSADGIPDETPEPQGTCGAKPKCAGSCGVAGLCPGVAIMIAWGIALAVVALTGREWIGWSVGVPLALILMTGVWKWRPGKSPCGGSDREHAGRDQSADHEA